MNYKKLGNTDLNVSTICLGTMTWGEQNSEKEGFEQMDFALNQGVNFWDTAEIYSIPMREETYGETERIIGNWFEKTKKRNEIVLATKVCGNTSNKYIRGGGNSFGGACGQCETEIVELDGEIIHRDHWLDSEEQDSGTKIMPCVSRFLGNSLVINR